MSSVNTKLHKRQNLGGKTVYQYRFDLENGMDTRLCDRQGEGHKAAYLKNLYRNKKSPMGTVESFPGYRRILQAFDGAGRLNGAFCHRFSEGLTLILHIGTGVYGVLAEDAPSKAAPQYLTAANDAPSHGVSYGEHFLLFDQKNVIQLSTGGNALILGDEAYTDEMEDYGELPTTAAYIPLLLKNGKPYEARNLLTAYYDIEDTTSPSRRIYDDFGLKLRTILYEGKEALEVYGIDPLRQALFVPNEAEFLGEVLPIVSVADGAFVGSNVKTAVFSKNVKQIATDGTLGAFDATAKLEMAAFFGAEAIGINAFAGCPLLREVVLPQSLSIVGEGAFADCPSLERVYYEGESYDSSLYDFGENAIVVPKTYLAQIAVGEEVRVALDPDKYSKVYSLSESSAGAMTKFTRYGGWSVGVLGDDKGYAAVAKSPCALCGISFDCHLGSESNRYAFLTVLGEGRMFTEAEEPTAVYEFSIPEDCQALASVTLDGKTASYRAIFKTENGMSRLAALRFVFPKACEKTLMIRVFSKGKDIGALSSYATRYDGSAASLVRGARAVAIRRGELLLSGNPALPGAVLRSATSPRMRDESLYFPSDAAVWVGERTVNAILPCKERVALLSSDRVLYLEKGVIAEGVGAYDAVSYRDDRYLLLSDGVYRLSEGVSVSYTHLEPLSEPIGNIGLDFSKGKLAVWRGYLVLCFGSMAFLADLDSHYREAGKDLCPWYMLDSLGDGAGKPFTHLVVADDLLFFFTEEGNAFLVEDSLSEFDGRERVSEVISEAYDMDCGYLYKKLCRGSLTISHLVTGHDTITVSMANEGEDYVPFGSIDPEKAIGQRETVAVQGTHRRFLRQVMKITGKTLSLVSAAFRYTVSERRVR